MATVRDSRFVRRLKLDDAWTLRAADLALGPNLTNSLVVHRRDPVTGRSLERVAVLVMTGATTGRLLFVYPAGPSVELVATPQPRGGARWWFTDGHGRCSTIVRPAGESRFRSRQAWGAASYPSQRQSPRRRAANRATSIRLALGGSADISQPFPERPAGMHHATYERRRAEAEAAAAIAIAGRRALATTTELRP